MIRKDWLRTIGNVRNVAKAARRTGNPTARSRGQGMTMQRVDAHHDEVDLPRSHRRLMAFAWCVVMGESRQG